MMPKTAPRLVRRPLIDVRPGCAVCHFLLSDRIFTGALLRECRRADRSNRPLVVLRARVDAPPERSLDVERAVVCAVTAVKREVDVAGWLERDRQIALIVSEVVGPAQSCARDLENRVREHTARHLGPRASRFVTIEAYVYSEAKAESGVDTRPVDQLLPTAMRATPYDVAKRMIDVIGSTALLAILSPLFAAIALLVKLKSPGPVFFKQVRVGQGMKPFTMLKFRTMHVNTSHDAHVEFVTAFIKAGQQANAGGQAGLFKIANDPRVTSIGRLLRKTSLDELPQLWNVVRGDMSLVGPRPPLSYEVEKYQPWHRRRVLDAKPGITGLWQVAGRSRTTFDEMVRLDLRYAKTRSLWTDLKILLATPAAVIVGKGAV